MATTATLCYITTCKGRLHHLKQTLPRVVDQPGVACVVVDYACPDGTADWVQANFPQVSVVRVSGEPGFSASRARNLGASAADAPWLAFFDADILWAPQMARELIPRLQIGHYYRAQPFTFQTWGSIVCQRKDFEALGGYDEAFSGWGGEDDDLIARLSLLGLTADGFPDALVGEISHEDEARVRFHSVKNLALQHRINHLYMQAKLDVMRLHGGPLPLETRQVLASEVTRAIREAAKTDQPSTTVAINFPPVLVKPPPVNGILEQWHINKKMIYSIDITSRHTSKI